MKEKTVKFAIKVCINEVMCVFLRNEHSSRNKYAKS